MAPQNISAGSSTEAIEMPSAVRSPPASTKDQPRVIAGDITARPMPAQTKPIPAQKKWNSDKTSMARVFATFFSFIILGANDAAYGAILPYLEKYYNVSYTVISLVFLSPIVGYTLSALLNNSLHVKYGQRGVAISMSLAHLIAYIIISQHPPYPALVVVFILAGFGNGLGDAAWNAWVGDMANPNEILGFLHAFYGLGAAVAPLIATTLITKANWGWYQFYYFMVGGAVLELASLTATFWRSTASQYNAAHPAEAVVEDSGTATPTDFGPALLNQTERSASMSAAAPEALQQRRKSKADNLLNIFSKSGTTTTKSKSRTAEAIKNKVTIITSLFLLIYVGVEVAIGGWIVTFMLNVREGSAFASGMTSVGFWLGITVGRLILGFVTPRLFKTEKHAVAVYLVICVALQLMFWLIPQFIVSAIMVSLVGFFLGPLFPAAVVALTKLLPKHLHVAAVGFAAAFGASGACILPFLTGAIANAVGVKVLQPVILAGIVGCLGTWLCLPKLPKQRTS